MDIIDSLIGVGFAGVAVIAIFMIAAAIKYILEFIFKKPRFTPKP